MRTVRFVGLNVHVESKGSAVEERETQRYRSPEFSKKKWFYLGMNMLLFIIGWFVTVITMMILYIIYFFFLMHIKDKQFFQSMIPGRQL